MPILEISSAQAPKDLNTFTKNMNALFAEMIGKPESVSKNFILYLIGILIDLTNWYMLVLFGYLHQGW